MSTVGTHVIIFLWYKFGGVSYNALPMGDIM